METDRPNIVFIQNDHQVYYRHGFEGGIGPMRPNFQQLAQSGAVFENAYCTTPLCAPTRRTMMTGEYTHTHQQYYNYCDMPFSQTYLQVLAENGYRNYYYGKWHAGNLEPLKQFTEDYFSCEGYGNPYLTPEYKAYLQRYHLEPARTKVEWAFTMDQYEEANYWPELKTGAVYEQKGTWCGEHAIGTMLTDKQSHESFFLANLACERLEKLSKEKGDRPFALRVDFWGPHQPFFPTQEFIDMYDPSEIDLYPSLHSDLQGKPDMFKIEWNIPFGENNRLCQPAKVTDDQWRFILSRVYAHSTMVDAAGGLILNKLKELGLDKNTLIVWTADHGDSVASNGGHFDKGSHMCEEVMRIPLAMSWKGVIPPQTVCSELVETIDYPVTLLDAAGLAFDKPHSGRSLLGLFHGKVSWREDMMCESFGHGHGEFHLSRLVRYRNYKLVYHHEESQINELYDLERDPYEMENLYDCREYIEVREDMLTRMKRLMRETGDPIADEALFNN